MILISGKLPNIGELYSSLSIFLLEAARENLSPSQIETILNGFNWSYEQINCFSKIYATHQVKIRASLKLFGGAPPKIVDINWRLDYEIEVICVLE